MARAGSPRGLSPIRRGPTSTPTDAGDTPVIPLSAARGKYRGLTLISADEAAASGLSQDDLQAIDDIWVALLDSRRMSDAEAADAFDRMLGWALGSTGPSGLDVDITDATMAIIRARRAQ